MRRYILLSFVLFFPIFINAQDSTLTDTLVAYYPFSGNAMDSSGFENHGEVFGATLTKDRFGSENSAYYFDGSFDYIDTFSSFDLPDRSISIWFRSDSEDIESLPEQNIFDQDSDELEYGVWRGSLDFGRFSLLDGGGSGRLNTFNVIETSQWYHAVISKEDTLVRYFLNGDQIGTTPIDSVGSSNNAYENIVFGTNRERDRKFFYGAIDDIRIYNYGLSDSAIVDLYTEGGWPLPQDSVEISSDTLVAYYPFSGNAMDSSGFENHGEVFGATLTKDRFGSENSAYYFDGSFDYIDTFSSFDLPDRSISIWFRSDSEDIESLPEQNIFDQDSDELEYGVWRGSLDFGRFSLLDGGGSGRLNTFNVIETSQWYHAVISKEDTLVRYFLNGDQIGTTPIDSVGSSNNAYENIVFGTNRERDRKFFYGVIDDIRIYNYGLSDSAIVDLYTEGGWPLPQDSVESFSDTLVAYYPFSGNAMDSSGFENHGEVFGATLTEDRFGNENSAYEFDGSYDYIDIDTSLNSSILEGFTFSVWGKGTSDEASITGFFTTNYGFPLMFGIDDGDRILLRVSQENEEPTELLIDSVYTETSEWYHYTGVFMPNEFFKVYRNGKLLGEETNSVPAVMDMPDSNIRIGARRHSTDESKLYFFKGSIDDIRIYNYALSDSAIVDLYTEGGWPLPQDSVTLIPPKNVMAKAHLDEITITWDYENIEDLGYYQIFRDGEIIQENLIGGKDDTTFVDGDLPFTKEYTYFLTVKDSAGRVSQPSDTVSATAINIEMSSDIFYSEFIEGSYYQKAMEIYNPTLDTVLLKNYKFPSVHNTPENPGFFDHWFKFPEDAKILPKDVYVLVHELADSNLLKIADHQVDFLSNGDDAFGLVYGVEENYIILDLIGSLFGDPGSGWSVGDSLEGTKDHTLVRKPEIMKGNPESLASFGTTDENSEWILYPKDTYQFLGFHAEYDSTETNNELISEIPESYQLYQNYPNPFNPNTIISFDMPPVWICFT